MKRLPASAPTICMAALAIAGCSSSGGAAPRGEVPVVSSGASLVPGRLYSLDAGTHCGVRDLANVDGRNWTTDEANGTAADWMPSEWAAELPPGQGLIRLEVQLSSDSSKFVATVAGRSVVYRPTTEADAVRLCE